MIASPLATAGGAMLDGAGIIVALFFLLLNSATAVLLIRAMPELWRHWDLAGDGTLAPVLASDALPTVSVVVTGAADRATTIDNVRSLLALRYPRHEVVLVHDGAASGDLLALVQAFDLYQVPPAILVNVSTGPVRGYYRSRRHGKLFLIDKEHLGRADDLNAALNASRFPYVLTMDVRTWLEPDALQRLMRPFLLGERVAAVAGTARVASGRGPAAEQGRTPTGWMPGVQAVEHLREAAFGRMGWNSLGGHLLIPNGVLLHQRDRLLQLDGYRGGPGDEELDLVVRLRRHLRSQGLSDAIPVIPDLVAWTLAPASPHAVVSQRGRLYRDQLEVLRSSDALFSARHGVARVLAPLHLAAVTVVAPLMELAGYLLLVVGLLTRGPTDPFIPLFAVAALGYAMLLTLWAVALEATSGQRAGAWRDVARLALFAVAEQLWFRQLVMWSRLHAAWGALWGGPSGDRERLIVPTGAADGALVTPDRARTS